LNRRRQPFQGFSSQRYLLIPLDLAHNTYPKLPSLLEPDWSQSCKNLSLSRFASDRHGFELPFRLYRT